MIETRNPNRKPNPALTKRLVIDESVSSRQIGAFVRFCSKRRIVFDAQLRLAESHPGISDDLVIHHLLSPQTLLLTTDRPFHNKALGAGFESFHVDEQTRFTGTRLKGIRNSAVTPLHAATRTAKGDYLGPKSELQPLVMPESERALKKLRTKRRRIRNHFGGYDNLGEVTITVSVDKQLVGIRIRISGLTGQKALDATESYIRHPGPDIATAVSCYALILALRLKIQTLRTTLYFDTDRIQHPDQCGDDLWSRQRSDFPRLTLVECRKGPILERLRAKLATLPRDSNEPVAGDLDAMRRRFVPLVSGFSNDRRRCWRALILAISSATLPTATAFPRP